MSHKSNGHDAADTDEITWVGEQRLMDGYCGRAKAVTGAADAKPVDDNCGAASHARAGRSQPGRGKVVRIGPPQAVGANQMTPATAKTLQRAA